MFPFLRTLRGLRPGLQAESNAVGAAPVKPRGVVRGVLQSVRWRNALVVEAAATGGWAGEPLFAAQARATPVSHLPPEEAKIKVRADTGVLAGDREGAEATPHRLFAAAIARHQHRVQHVLKLVARVHTAAATDPRTHSRDEQQTDDDPPDRRRRRRTCSRGG